MLSLRDRGLGQRVVDEEFSIFKRIEAELAVGILVLNGRTSLVLRAAKGDLRGHVAGLALHAHFALERTDDVFTGVQ